MRALTKQETGTDEFQGISTVKFCKKLQKNAYVKTSQLKFR